MGAVADDIFITPPAVATRKVRWHEVVIGNPYMGMPMLTASAQVLDLTAGGQMIRMERSPAHDLVIGFNPESPKHVQLAALMDNVVKEAYAEREGNG